MLVKHVMKSNSLTATSDDSIVEAAQKMARHGAPWLVVTNESGVIGVISEGDLVSKVVARDARLNRIPVRRIMKDRPVTCRADDTVETAAHLMRENKVNWLVVVDERDQPIGSVSLNS